MASPACPWQGSGQGCLMLCVALLTLQGGPPHLCSDPPRGPSGCGLQLPAHTCLSCTRILSLRAVPHVCRALLPGVRAASAAGRGGPPAGLTGRGR